MDIEIIKLNKALDRALEAVFDTSLNLTPKEAAIVSKLCDGFSLKEIAQSYNLSYETVRTHLKPAFANTKTNR